MNTVWKELLRQGCNGRPFRVRRTDLKCRVCRKPITRPLVRFRFPEAVDYVGLPQGTYWLSRDDIYNNYKASEDWTQVIHEGFPEELHVNPRDVLVGSVGCEECQPAREAAVGTDWDMTLALPSDLVLLEDMGVVKFAGVDVRVIGGRRPLLCEQELRAALRSVLETPGWQLNEILMDCAGSGDKALTVFWLQAVESFYHGLPLPQVVRRAARFRQLGMNLVVIPMSDMDLVPDVPIVLAKAN
jgi:hypothetical protein